MATILAHIAVKPGTASAFESVARSLHEASHRLEDGLLRYEYWRGAEENTYYTLLSFTDHQTFIAHQTSDHHEDASPALGDMIASIRLEWVDPIEGAASLPPTEDQDAPDDADELTRRYRKLYAAAVAPWWTPLR